MSLPDYHLLAKQAIYDRQRKCVAHELLFRSPLNIAAKDVGSDVATQQVLVNYCTSITQTADLSVGPVFLNVDTDFIKKHRSLPVDPDKVYIEVNNFDSPDEAILEALAAWTKQGFKLGLTDFDFSQAHLSALEYFYFVKVDMLHEPARMLECMAAMPKKRGLLWIAERIENEAVFEACVEAGFKLFQGYFLARPKDLMGAAIRPGTGVTIRIVKELERPDISMDQIAELVGQDPKLAVQMLKIINSPLFALPKVVDDLRDALVFLGLDMLRHWAMILSFLSNGTMHVESSRIILNRAKACELLCRSKTGDAALGAAAFLSGLVSGVDVLVRVAPERFLEQVVLSDQVVAAVLRQEGEVGRHLKQVLELEQMFSQIQKTPVSPDENLIEAYRAADDWTDQVVVALKN